MKPNIQDLRRYFLDPFKHENLLSEFQPILEAYAAELQKLTSAATPILGQWMQSDYKYARSREMPQFGGSTETVLRDVFQLVPGSTDWAHPLNIIAAAPPPTKLSLAVGLICNHLNPNLTWDHFSQGFAQAEIALAAMIAALIGYNPEKSVGISTYGGAGTNLYGIKVGLEKARRATGQGLERMCVFKSRQGHFSSQIAVNWLGLDSEQLIEVATKDHHMDYDDLREQMRRAIESGYVIAAVVAESGSTYDFGLDDLQLITAVRDQIKDDFSLRYCPHVHADAVIGWIFSVFNDYDFDVNPLEISSDTLGVVDNMKPLIQSLQYADSVGIDFHKLAYAPLTSSLFVVKDGCDLGMIARDEKFSPDDFFAEYGSYSPGVLTLECTRSAAGMMFAYVNSLLLGKSGYQLILANNIERSQQFSAALRTLPYCRVMNSDTQGPAVVVRFYPTQDDKWAEEQGFCDEASIAKINKFNEELFARTYTTTSTRSPAQMSLAKQYLKVRCKSGHVVAISALKSYMISPFTEEVHIDDTVNSLKAAYISLVPSFYNQ